MNPDRAREIIARLAEEPRRTLVLGDVMLDRFIWGDVGRISPEAPVPVVEVREETCYPGGAANVARNIIPFTGQAGVLGMVGEGWEADRLLRILGENRIDTAGLLHRPGFQTIVKTRIIARNQQVVRIDRENPAPLREEDRQAAAEFIRARVGEIDAIIIEDYAKGFITQDLVDAIHEVTREAGITITVDPNPGNPIDWRGASAIKPNRIEAYRVAGIPESTPAGHPLDDRPLLEVGGILLEKWDTPAVLITLGEKGMLLFERRSDPYHIPTRAREIFDVSGAGDTAIALFTLALAAGCPPREAAELANHASGVVVGKIGTATLTPEELVASFDG